MDEKEYHKDGKTIKDEIRSCSQCIYWQGCVFIYDSDACHMRIEYRSGKKIETKQTPV